LKKYFFVVFCLGLFLITAFYSGCNTAPPNAAITSTPSGALATFTQTSLAGIATPTFTYGNTPVISPTITPTFTASAGTPTNTVTLTPTMSCFNPHIKALSGIYQMGTPSTTLYILGACKPQSGLVYSAAVYDGSDNLVAIATAVQTACGELRYSITVASGAESANSWHVGIMELTATPPASYSASAPEFKDTDSFFVMSSPPTMTPTPPCTNMAAVYAGYCSSGLIQKSAFAISACDKVTFKNNYCMGAYRAAFYDGAGALKKTQDCPCAFTGTSAQTVEYIFSGTESTGTWHVDLFDINETPPLMRGSGGTVTTCPPNISFVTF